MTMVGVAVMVIASVAVPAKDKPKNYQTGKLLDVTVEDVNRGIGVVGGMAAPIPGKLYVFKIQLEDLVYIAEYKAGKLSYKPEWIVNDSIELRFDKAKMFLKRPDGKELEVDGHQQGYGPQEPGLKRPGLKRPYALTTLAGRSTENGNTLVLDGLPWQEFVRW
jgi:hypothetical protein